jgi:hypothetical protein
LMLSMDVKSMELILVGVCCAVIIWSCHLVPSVVAVPEQQITLFYQSFWYDWFLKRCALLALSIRTYNNITFTHMFACGILEEETLEFHLGPHLCLHECEMCW